MGALEYVVAGTDHPVPEYRRRHPRLFRPVPGRLVGRRCSQFIASHYDGAQKMRTVFTDAVRAYNEDFVMLHYRLAVRPWAARPVDRRRLGQRLG